MSYVFRPSFVLSKTDNQQPSKLSAGVEIKDKRVKKDVSHLIGYCVLKNKISVFILLGINVSFKHVKIYVRKLISIF